MDSAPIRILIFTGTNINNQYLQAKFAMALINPH